VTPRLVFRPEAEAELLDARDWYEAERLGLGTVFAAAVETAVTAILDNPSAYPRVKGDTRRALIRTVSVRRLLPSHRRRDHRPGRHAWPQASATLAIATLSLTSGWRGPASPAAHPSRKKAVVMRKKIKGDQKVEVSFSPRERVLVLEHTFTGPELTSTSTRC
jgi:hypothetical protein